MESKPSENITTYYKVTAGEIKEAIEYEERRRKREEEPQIEKQYLPGEPEPSEDKIKISYTEPKSEPDTNAIPITIVSREEWGALPRPKVEEVFPAKVPFVHQEYNSGTPQCYSFEECSRTVREIQRRDMELGFPDIRYNFLVGDDWNVYEGRGWYVTPEPTTELPRYHNKYLEFAFIGNMWRPNHPTYLQSKMVWSLLKKGIEKIKIIDNMHLTFIMKHLDFYHNIKQAA